MSKKPKIDLYKELGISNNSTQEEIKKAYRKLAMVRKPKYNKIIRNGIPIKMRIKNYQQKSFKK